MSYMFHYCTTTFDYSKTVVHFFNESMKPLLDSTYGFNAFSNIDQPCFTVMMPSDKEY